jgi:predicted metal-dependent hydrolase
VNQAARQLSLFSDADEPGHSPGFSVRENSRARRLSIKVYPRGRVEVVVPPRTRPELVQAFVRENNDWINIARAEFAKTHDPEPFALPNVIDLAAIGQRFRVRYQRESGSKSVRYRSRRNLLVLSGHTSDEKLCVAALKRWLAGVAREAFAPRLRALACVTGNPYKTMHVRGQKTCWGSRSSSGTISVNYCLLFLEPAVLRYLMIHELCHGRHMNHSARFWKHVASFEPDYKRLDRALSESWNKVPVWVGIH